MDLAWNPSFEFTKWVVSAGLLTEPFVLIDVGVQGGEHIRWSPLGDFLVVHGFDPIEEVVKNLTARGGGRTNRHYHFMALGNSDGTESETSTSTLPTRLKAQCIGSPPDKLE
jgi:hypothetical protein